MERGGWEGRRVSECLGLMTMMTLEERGRLDLLARGCRRRRRHGNNDDQRFGSVSVVCVGSVFL